MVGCRSLSSILTETNRDIAINLSIGFSTFNFMVFNGIWTAFLATPYLAFAPAVFPHTALQYVVPAVELVTTIFWFSGFVATATILPPPRMCHGGLCNSLQAATVFGAFEWYVLCPLLYWEVLSC